MSAIKVLKLDKEQLLIDLHEAIDFYGKRSESSRNTKIRVLHQGRIEGYIEALEMAGVLTETEAENAMNYYKNSYHRPF